MRNLEIRTEDNKKIIADLRSSLDPSSCRCFVDVFLNRQLQVEVRSLDFATLYKMTVERSVWSLVSSEIRNQELALPRAQSTLQCYEPVCSRNGHNSSHTPVVFALHGQVPSFSRCRNTPMCLSDHWSLVCHHTKILFCFPVPRPGPRGADPGGGKSPGSSGG